MRTLRIAALLLAASPAAAGDAPVALVGGTVHTAVGPALEGATVVVEGDHIAAVGAVVAPPEGARVVDVTGRHLFPGFVSANTVLGLTEIAAVDMTNDFAETGDLNPGVRAEIAFNPDSELIPVARVAGITSALVVPRGGVVAGSSALVRLDGWTWEDMTRRAPVGLHVVWPEMRPRERRFGPPRSEEEQKRERDEALERLGEAFGQARAWWKAHEAEEHAGVPRHDRDLTWEAMGPVLHGEVPLFVHASALNQIRAALDFLDEQEIPRAVLVGGADAWRVAEELKRREIPVIADPTLALPRRDYEPYDAAFTLPARLHEAGVLFCIADAGVAFAAPNARNLPHHAAMAAAFGLPREEALRAITLYPARILGLGDSLGSIEAGKRADLVVADGDPLELTTRVEQVWIDGRETSMESRHTRFFEKWHGRPRPEGDAGSH